MIHTGPMVILIVISIFLLVPAFCESRISSTWCRAVKPDSFGNLTDAFVGTTVSSDSSPLVASTVSHPLSFECTELMFFLIALVLYCLRGFPISRRHPLAYHTAL